jgi:hypothetical protein
MIKLEISLIVIVKESTKISSYLTMQPLPIKVIVISSISNEANCFRCSFIDNLSPVNDDISVKFGFLHL